MPTSALKNHLLREHSSKPEVRPAYLRDDAEKVVDATPRQTILKYAKAMSKHESNIDHYMRGSYMDVDLNRALTQWLSLANLPYNILGGGGFLSVCFKMNPWCRVPSRPYIQRNFLDKGYETCAKMLYLDPAAWLSSDAWKSRYGKFSIISLTVHFLDEEWNYPYRRP